MTGGQISKYPSSFYRVALKAVIRNDKNEILVVKEHDLDTWDIPGGGWDHGETEKEALARELYEEVGYEGDFKYSLVKTAVFWIELKQAYLLWIVYDVRTENMGFRPGADCSEIAFMHPRTFLGDEYQGSREKWIAENLN